jgi:hypothetical protein
MLMMASQARPHPERESGLLGEQSKDALTLIQLGGSRRPF